MQSRRAGGFILARTFRLVRAQPAKFLKIVFFDILLIAFLVILRTTSELYSSRLAEPTTKALAFTYLFFYFLYYIAVLFVISFFVYTIMHYIINFFERKTISYSRFGEFFSLNITLAGIFVSLLLLFIYIIDGVKQQYQIPAFFAMAFVFIATLYSTISISHSCFFAGDGWKASVKKGIVLSFTGIRKNWDMVLTPFAAAAAMWAVYFAVAKLIELLSSINFTFFIKVYYYFSLTAPYALFFLMLMLLNVNRISFYSEYKHK